MDPGGQIEIRGLEQLTGKLAALPRRVSGQIARKALRAGAKLIQARAVALAPRRTGLLAKSIKVRSAKRSRGRFAGVLITTNESSFAPKGKAFYAYFQERGWRVGKRRAQKSKQAAHDARKFVEGKHFMQHAFDETKDAAAAVIERELAAGIEQAMKQ